MSGDDVVHGLTMVILAAVAGVAIPWAGIRMLVPSLASQATTVSNYRGRDVFLGLGLVWAFWLLGVGVFLVFARDAASASIALGGGPLALALPLVGGAFLFGLVDDAFGSGTEKGFRGHLTALVRGRLTTGALKLLGIGLISLFGGAQVALAGPIDVRSVVHLLSAAMVCALCANTVNLFDLRPGRALKAYGVLALVGVLLIFATALTVSPMISVLFPTAVVALFCMGPVLAVWRYDVGEMGMLGDAGANGLGMLVGVLLISALPVEGTVVLAGALFALNLASEKISFSAVIERSAVLSAVDRIGRQGVGEIDTQFTADDMQGIDPHDTSRG